MFYQSLFIKRISEIICDLSFCQLYFLHIGANRQYSIDTSFIQSEWPFSFNVPRRLRFSEEGLSCVRLHFVPELLTLSENVTVINFIWPRTYSHHDLRDLCDTPHENSTFSYHNLSPIIYLCLLSQITKYSPK